MNEVIVINAMAIVAEYLLRRQATYAEAQAAIDKARSEGRHLTDAELDEALDRAQKAVDAIG